MAARAVAARGEGGQMAARQQVDGTTLTPPVDSGTPCYQEGSLSPTADGPRVGVYGDGNWWIYFAIPGDDSTGAITSHGNGLRVEGMRNQLRETRIWLPDETHRALLFTDTVLDDPVPLAGRVAR